MMLGPYSYLHGNERRFSYTTANTKGSVKTHHFALMPVDEDIAVMRFFTDERFVEPKPVPPEFKLTGPKVGKWRAFEGCFLLQVTLRRSTRAAHVSAGRNAISTQNGAVILSCP
jgi:hypothetical protein